MSFGHIPKAEELNIHLFGFDVDAGIVRNTCDHFSFVVSAFRFTCLADRCDGEKKDGMGGEL